VKFKMGRLLRERLHSSAAQSARVK
jgi:hypothetical protein